MFDGARPPAPSPGQRGRCSLTLTVCSLSTGLFDPAFDKLFEGLPPIFPDAFPDMAAVDASAFAFLDEDMLPCQVVLDWEADYSCASAADAPAPPAKVEEPPPPPTKAAPARRPPPPRARSSEARGQGSVPVRRGVRAQDGVRLSCHQVRAE